MDSESFSLIVLKGEIFGVTWGYALECDRVFSLLESWGSI